jgi:enamine deaminase RidA (YjgF/YER057c/UK114 family)
MSLSIEITNPKELGAPLGLYRQISRVKASEFLFIAGQLSVNLSGESVGRNDFNKQMDQVFRNIGDALRSANCTFSNVVKFTTYLTRSDNIPVFMDARKRLFPSLFKNDAYPPNTLLIVDRLVQEEFLVEVETTAAI